MEDKKKEINIYLIKNILRIFVIATATFIFTTLVSEKIGMDSLKEYAGNHIPEMTAVGMCLAILIFFSFNKIKNHFFAKILNSIDTVFLITDIVIN